MKGSVRPRGYAQSGWQWVSITATSSTKPEARAEEVGAHTAGVRALIVVGEALVVPGRVRTGTR
jgi:hypothetical protein